MGAIEYVKQINLKNPSTTHYLKTIDQSEYIVDTLDHDSLANWIEQGDFESSLMFQFESENSDTARQIRADIGQSLKRHFSSDAHGNITLANIDVPEALKQTEKL